MLFERRPPPLVRCAGLFNELLFVRTACLRLLPFRPFVRRAPAALHLRPLVRRALPRTPPAPACSQGSRRPAPAPSFSRKRGAKSFPASVSVSFSDTPSPPGPLTGIVHIIKPPLRVKLDGRLYYMYAFASQSPGSQHPDNRSSRIARSSKPVISYYYRKTKNNSPKQSPHNDIYNIWGRFSVMFDTNNK